MMNLALSRSLQRALPSISCSSVMGLQAVHISTTLSVPLSSCCTRSISLPGYHTSECEFPGSEHAGSWHAVSVRTLSTAAGAGNKSVLATNAGEDDNVLDAAVMADLEALASQNLT